jgi:hypothetical protein
MNQEQLSIMSHDRRYFTIAQSARGAVLVIKQLPWARRWLRRAAKNAESP